MLTDNFVCKLGNQGQNEMELIKKFRSIFGWLWAGNRANSPRHTRNTNWNTSETRLVTTSSPQSSQHPRQYTTPALFSPENKSTNRVSVDMGTWQPSDSARHWPTRLNEWIQCAVMVTTTTAIWPNWANQYCGVESIKPSTFCDCKSFCRSMQMCHTEMKHSRRNKHCNRWKVRSK